MNVLKPDKKSTIITLLKNGVGQREIRLFQGEINTTKPGRFPYHFQNSY